MRREAANISPYFAWRFGWTCVFLVVHLGLCDFFWTSVPLDFIFSCNFSLHFFFSFRHDCRFAFLLFLISLSRMAMSEYVTLDRRNLVSRTLDRISLYPCRCSSVVSNLFLAAPALRCTMCGRNGMEFFHYLRLTPKSVTVTSAEFVAAQVALLRIVNFSRPEKTKVSKQKETVYVLFCFIENAASFILFSAMSHNIVLPGCTELTKLRTLPCPRLQQLWANDRTTSSSAVLDLLLSHWQWWSSGTGCFEVGKAPVTRHLLALLHMPCGRQSLLFFWLGSLFVLGEKKIQHLQTKCFRWLFHWSWCVGSPTQSVVALISCCVIHVLSIDVKIKENG